MVAAEWQFDKIAFYMKVHMEQMHTIKLLIVQKIALIEIHQHITNLLVYGDQTVDDAFEQR